MLFFPELFTEENKPKKKNIHRALHGRMLPDLLPCPFHSGTPVNIIKHQNGVIVQHWQQLLKVVDCGLVAVVAVDVGKINGGKLVKNTGQQLIKIAHVLPDIFQM